MGIYIDPKEGTKEMWLEDFAVEVPSVEWDEVPEDTLPVVLVNNGAFTAAGIAYCRRELKAFQMPDDRPMRWFIADVADLIAVQPATRMAMEDAVKYGW